MQVADHRLILHDAIYSVVSPESCSAILFRTADRVENAMQIFRPTAAEVSQVGIVEEIVAMQGDIMCPQHDEAARVLGAAIKKGFDLARKTACPGVRNFIARVGASTL